MATGLHLTTLVSTLGRRLASADATTPVEPIRLFHEYEFVNGTGSGQADEWWAKEGELNAGNSYSVSYDVADGTLTNFQGTAIAFVKIKGVYVENRSTISGDLMTMTGDFARYFGDGADSQKIGPGGVHYAVNPLDGWSASVVFDTLTLSSSSKTIAYTVALLGTTA